MTVPLNEDPLERALREAPPPVADDGFGERVLFALPRRRRAGPSRSAAIVIAAAAAGSLVALAVPGDVGTLSAGVSDLLSGRLFHPDGLALVVSFATLCWAGVTAALRE